MRNQYHILAEVYQNIRENEQPDQDDTDDLIRGLEALAHPEKVIELELRDRAVNGVIEGDVIIREKFLFQLPNISDLVVTGYFDCYNNQLTSLQGAPREVGGSFWCQRNQLTSLQGAPRKVGGSFDCHRNDLTSLQGAPSKVGRSFYCSRNQLTSLQGAPREVGGGFDCSDNPVKFTKQDIKNAMKQL
jgi:hypothetical protein